MNRQEAERLTRQGDALRALGFTRDEAEALRRISMTLHRWHEHECNGTIQRDEETGKCYSHSDYDGRRLGLTADRETGALKRLQVIVGERNSRAEGGLYFYVQGDPRGCALYIIRPGDVPQGGDVGAYYSRGLGVY